MKNPRIHKKTLLKEIHNLKINNFWKNFKTLWKGLKTLMSQRVFNFNWEITLVKFKNFHAIEFIFVNNFEVTLIKCKDFKSKIKIFECN